MSRKRKSLDTLEELLKKTDTKAEFNIVEDLKSLERMHGVLKPRQYKQKLQAIIKKYEQSELTSVRSALLEKCQKGDVAAIRLYAEYFKPAETVAEDDGLIDVLTKASKGVFADG